MNNTYTKANASKVTNVTLRTIVPCKKQTQQRGASLVEYALLVALIAVVAIAAVRILGRNASSQFSTIAAQISG
jgi:pilus assembly protein Flp/PilA